MTHLNNNQASHQPTLLIMAGGTGGHIFPGLAVADQLKAQGWNIYWLGTADKMEAHIVPEHGYEISFITIGGVRHKGLLTRLATPFKLFKAIWQARKVLKKIKPDVVLGMGGYASAPGGIAAWLSGIPLLVHEQNAAAGLTNRLLAKFANKVCCAFPNAFSNNVNAEVVGNPLRASIGQVADVKATGTRNILIVGGSLGAQVLNNTVPASVKSLQERFDNVAIWHQTGKGNAEQVLNAYDSALIKQQSHDAIKVDEFIHNMAAAYAWADIVICRAGALTVSELAMAATPAIFVPLPHAVDDHQTKNAHYLVNCGAAKLLAQVEFNEHSLTNMLTALFTETSKLTLMAEAAANAADGQATVKVANLCQQLLAPSRLPQDIAVKNVTKSLDPNKKEIK
ncbi:undecaprenyldiphospho-muramoylpentapeptide beta-N-acetylglucosaminyltransferase [Colwellia asteriadis]|uniref:UDP-N-acetylglucosamine--N-acetylmuramyl-(pentapeptide) pyrophosphoryl-undecaprenol N-acetylglucosamine transferase n=1 Tax=Colwellia asteriadis TaxID=517723 RepID=A0ABN1L5I0_9GAMM